MNAFSQRPRLHPMLWAAGLSVTAFSLVGIVAITGLLPQAHGTMAESEAPFAAKVADAPAADTAVTAPTATAKAKPAVKPQHVVAHRAPRTAPQIKVASNEPYIEAHEDATGLDMYGAHRAAPVCADCGRIESVQAVTRPGEANGLGAIAGGVVGGLLGHNIGNGHGRDLATIAAIAGGAYAGHEIEKSQRATTVYDVTVRMDDGSRRTLTENDSAWRVGDPVRVNSDGTLALR